MTQQTKYNTQNLKPFNQLTAEECHSIRSKGGKASAAARRRRKEAAMIQTYNTLCLEQAVKAYISVRNKTAISLPVTEKTAVIAEK